MPYHFISDFILKIDTDKSTGVCHGKGALGPSHPFFLI